MDRLSLRETEYVLSCQEELVTLIEELCRIPAPSHKEEQRAAFCAEWLKRAGATSVWIDKAKNVVCQLGELQDGIPVYMAHTDTVFPDMEPMPFYEKEGKLYSPGVGDDTANVAVLLLIARYLLQNHITPPKGMLIILNSCEEGLGNLKGVRQIVEDYGTRIHHLVSFDGYTTGVCNDAVGSKRYQVTVKTEGGHSYGKFGNRNAIHYLASMITQLYAMKVPDFGSKTTYNVGTISGGTSVNTIAQQAQMLYEYRSDQQRCLAIMDEFFAGVIHSYRQMGIEVEVELLGERPCKGEVDSQALDALTQRACSIISSYLGRMPVVSAGSTDCNIPLSMGIPAVCFGVCQGGGAHTREEWIDKGSLIGGFSAALAMVLSDC